MKHHEKLTKAIKYITNIRDQNQVTLDSFEKEIEEDKNANTKYSTSVYDHRVENCNMAIEALKKQIPVKPISKQWAPCRCATCDKELSQSIGDGYYKHWTYIKVCDCGQQLDWCDLL